jgi:hypothetical protein
MSEQARPTALLALMGLIGLLLGAGEARALSSFGGFLNNAFDPNNTFPHLELQVVGSTLESAGGVSLSTDTSFDLDIMLKDGGGADAYENLILTVATNSNALSISITCPVCGPGTVTLDSAGFGSATDFGLVFPPDGIRGIGNGAGDYLSLDGALVGGFDLMTGLERGSVESVRVAVEVAGFDYTSGDRLRLDVFGTDPDGSGNVIGNNPNSGAAGVAPEPSAGLVFGLGLLTVSRFVRRRR